MAGQGGGRLARLFAIAAILCFGVGCATGVLASVAGARSQWRIADLFFDLGLLILMVTRGPSLLKGLSTRSPVEKN